jgi:hypothetical protein
MLRIATAGTRRTTRSAPCTLTMSVVAVVDALPTDDPARRCCSAESAGQALARSIETARTVAWPRQSSAAAGE